MFWKRGELARGPCYHGDISVDVMAFLFPQANGHVSQDQEEPGYLESTARPPAEDETQVGPPLGSGPLPLLLHCSSQAVIGLPSAERESVCADSAPEVLCSGWSLV